MRRRYINLSLWMKTITFSWEKSTNACEKLTMRTSSLPSLELFQDTSPLRRRKKCTALLRCSFSFSQNVPNFPIFTRDRACPISCVRIYDCFFAPFMLARQTCRSEIYFNKKFAWKKSFYSLTAYENCTAGYACTTFSYNSGLLLANTIGSSAMHTNVVATPELMVSPRIKNSLPAIRALSTTIRIGTEIPSFGIEEAT